MPSLSQPFRLAVLPKIASLHNFSQKKTYIKVADSFTPDSNSVLLGISGSSISKYVITPTPRLIFNVPIPSTHLVSACNMGTYSETSTVSSDPQTTADETTDTAPTSTNTVEETKHYEIWCYALSANNKTHTLNCLIREVDNNNTSITENNPQFNAKFKEQIINIEVDTKHKVIVVLFETGLVQFYDLQLKLLNSINTPYRDIKIVKTFEENGLEYMLLISDLKDQKVALQLYEVSTEEKKVKELTSSIIENFNLQDSLLCYQFGRIYRLFKDEIEVYSIPSLQLNSKVKIPFLSEIEDKNCLISLKPIATNRVLLTVKNKIYLLDLLHKSILSEREVSHMKTFQILKTAMNRDGSESKLTLALGISTKNGQNPTSALEIINIDVGSNSLKDSLGKSFLRRNNQIQGQLKNLFPEPKYELPSINFPEILGKLKNANSAEKFDETFFNLLNIKEEMFTENSRFLNDQRFLASVLDLIFTKIDYNKSCPRSLMFLLTHPLFPKEKTIGLLTKVKSNSRLFKQAIVTCPNLPLQELLQELFTIKNSELVVDISMRILQDYTKDAIKEEIKKLDQVSVENFMNFIIKINNREAAVSDFTMFTPQIFKLLSLILDSIGLFGLEESILIQLSSIIEKEVKIAERNVELWNIMDAKMLSVKKSSSTAASKLAENSQTPYIVEYIDI